MRSYMSAEEYIQETGIDSFGADAVDDFIDMLEVEDLVADERRDGTKLYSVANLHWAWRQVEELKQRRSPALVWGFFVGTCQAFSGSCVRLWDVG